MKKITILELGVFASMALASCVSSSPQYLEMYSPEESGLNLIKITDEANGSVVGWSAVPLPKNTYAIYANLQCGFNKEKRIRWDSYPHLQVSPDGTKLAFVTIADNQYNIMVRNTNSQGISTQRTFRNVVGGFAWGNDGKLYFGDANRPNYYISSVDAEKGSIMTQMTSGTVDDSSPSLSSDCNILYFTRWVANYGPSIWALNKKDGTLSSCARGFNPCAIPGDNESFYCARNSTSGRSEIWHVNYVKGQESVILSDVNHGFTNPVLSPDGKWLLVVGNATSSISKKEDLDIFVVRTDGTQLTQLTYHPARDMSPAWSRDGKSIFFISSRANKELKYNIWKMDFRL